MLGQLCRRLATWKKHVGAADGHAYRQRPAATGTVVTQPHKHNADRRHHIPKMSFKLQNWPAYEAGLGVCHTAVNAENCHESYIAL
jgi:hypothetical protein